MVSLNTVWTTDKILQQRGEKGKRIMSDKPLNSTKTAIEQSVLVAPAS